jgi:pimeloyl-ACP methyl ester carboxylesterase
MVYLLDDYVSLFNLCWTQSPIFDPLPPTINRTFVNKSSGEIELLISAPSSEPGSRMCISRPSVLFVHGGFGPASVWLP